MDKMCGLVKETSRKTETFDLEDQLYCRDCFVPFFLPDQKNPQGLQLIEWAVNYMHVA